MVTAPCIHCGAALKFRRRLLCYLCYADRRIRELYPRHHLYGRRGFALSMPRRGFPPFPTHALPGTPEKVEVMRWRAECGFELFHPSDAQLAGSRHDQQPPGAAPPRAPGGLPFRPCAVCA